MYSRFAEHIHTIEAHTVVGKGWAGITNGKLLTLAQAEFDVFVTVDRNLSFQQHLPKFDIAVILLKPWRPRRIRTTADNRSVYKI